MYGLFTLVLWNKAMGKMDPALVARKELEGRIHLEFCAELYKLQLESGRFFLHEHPKDATSWKEPCILDTSKHENVQRINAHMCPFDMRVLDEGEHQLVYKPTTWMSNSRCILK